MKTINKKDWLVIIIVILSLAIICVAILILTRRGSQNSKNNTYSIPLDFPIPETPTTETEVSNTSVSNASANESTGVISPSDSGWSFQINEIEKSTKFSDVYAGYQKPITLIIEDPVSGATILEVQDLTSKSTNLNELVPNGTEYYLRFYDATGTLMEPAWPNVKTTH
ncbi:hypothetical protein KC842_00200 [Candidatus Nomurabacteria bacterium]|nr:hypothetical protein [Candidatus Nomurabacteria bacterium]USN94754.1 MAG: hypothetical protein H6791_03300 [Candidatus Nomurabacteria bacterium]